MASYPCEHYLEVARPDELDSRAAAAHDLDALGARTLRDFDELELEGIVREAPLAVGLRRALLNKRRGDAAPLRQHTKEGAG